MALAHISEQGPHTLACLDKLSSKLQAVRDEADVFWQLNLDVHDTQTHFTGCQTESAHGKQQGAFCLFQCTGLRLSTLCGLNVLTRIEFCSLVLLYGQTLIFFHSLSLV